MRKKVLISLEERELKLLREEAKKSGLTQSAYITTLLKNKEERLSKHIARDIENLLFLLLLNSNLDVDKKMLPKNIETILKQANQVGAIKGLYLKEKKEKKQEELKTFWNKILTMLEPYNFVREVSTDGKKIDRDKAINFIKKIYKVIKDNKHLWEK